GVELRPIDEPPHLSVLPRLTRCQIETRRRRSVSDPPLLYPLQLALLFVIRMKDSCRVGVLRRLPVPFAQRGGGGEADVASERDLPRRPGSLTGYPPPHLSRTLVLSLFCQCFQLSVSSFVSSI
ncbi:hypothetical protein BHE74_00059499, partial [Ensete ventricosum]